MSALPEHTAEDNPCADALDKLWRDVLLAHRPDYGDWEYPGQAYHHLLAEFKELRRERDEARAALRRKDAALVRIVGLTFDSPIVPEPRDMTDLTHNMIVKVNRAARAALDPTPEEDHAS